MEQATQPTSTTASPEARAIQQQDRQADAFDHAARLAAWYFRQLESKPHAVELSEEFPTGHEAHLKFRGGDARGVMAFAALADAPVTRATTALGVHLDVYARVSNVLVHGSTFLSHGEAARLDEQSPPPQPPADSAPAEEPEVVTVQPAPAVVPLGSSVTATVPTVAPATDGEE